MGTPDMLAKIRTVLTSLDSETADRQYALEEIDRIVNAAPEPTLRNDFPGVDMGMLAYDIGEAIARSDYRCLEDIGYEDIEANLPAFLAACLATAAEDENQS